MDKQELLDVIRELAPWAKADSLGQEQLEALANLLGWWDSLSDGFRELVLSCLAALPGGEKLEGLVEPAPLAWVEAELLGRLLLSLRDSEDVEVIVDTLLGPDEETEEEGEENEA